MNDNEQPLVSVILPTYNRANLIGRAIKSALTQTYQNFEIIVVDDCSTDNIDEALAKFNDSRIKCIRNNENKGGSGARNVGIEASSADYVAFLDDDDEWLPTKLEKQMQVFCKGNDKLGAVSCAAVKYRGGKKYLEKWPERRGDVYEYLVNTLRSYGTPMTIVKRKYLDQSGYFDESLPSHQELDLFIRLARYCEFDFVNEILVHIHSYPDGIIGNIHNAIRGRIIVLGKIEGEMHKDAASRHRLELGQHYSYAGDIQSARKEFIKSIYARPYAWKPYAHYVLSLFGLNVYLKFVLFRHKGSKELVSIKE